MQRITPCLWFDDKAEEAAKFYASIFKNSKIGGLGKGLNIHSASFLSVG
jgi:predicted 3-demethylubiquinone-9 3-methyltransferase (glyoxalase superfamily)